MCLLEFEKMLRVRGTNFSAFKANWCPWLDLVRFVVSSPSFEFVIEQGLHWNLTNEGWYFWKNVKNNRENLENKEVHLDNC